MTVVPARIRSVTFDCRDPLALARFWGPLLGFVEDPDDPNEPGDPEAVLVDPRGHHPALLFVPVPEPKAVKNRLHLDLRPVSGSGRDVVVEEVLTLGGSVVDDRREADGAGRVVVADPEGNELCIERSAAEKGEALPLDTGERPLGVRRTADERTMLAALLEWYREGVVAKVAGVRPAHAAARPLPSETSIAGIVKHLALVEDTWFTERFAGQPIPEPWAGVDWDADPDWEFRTARDEPLEDSVGLYRAACDRSRAVTAAHDLDGTAADASLFEFSLRWALLHLLEETARHLGHLDLLREHLDGTTGE